MQFQNIEDIDYTGLELDCPELFETMPINTSLIPTSNYKRALLALERSAGNHTLAAQQLGVSRSTFWRWSQTESH